MVRYYRVTRMCQKKELLGRTKNGLRNPYNLVARSDSERLKEKSSGGPSADAGAHSVDRRVGKLSGPAGAKPNPWASERRTPVFVQGYSIAYSPQFVKTFF